MSDQDMVVLVQTLLHYLAPATATPAFDDLEATVQRFRKMHAEYSLGHSPQEN